jgi:hypothetical protein
VVKEHDKMSATGSCGDIVPQRRAQALARLLIFALADSEDMGCAVTSALLRQCIKQLKKDHNLAESDLFPQRH